MKKILSTIALFLLVVAVNAQQAPVKMSVNDLRHVAKTASVNTPALTGFEDADYSNEVLPTPFYVNSTNRGSVAVCGKTKWIGQSNSSWHNKLVAHNDGTLSVIYPIGTTSAGRGTGYNYFNGTSWKSYSGEARIENARAGWGVVGTLSNKGEIVASHNGTTGLIISKRDQAGAGNGVGTWEHSILEGPELSNATTTSTGMLWPVMATVGDTVHIFALTDSDTPLLYQGVQTCLVYYRSCDRGATWDIQHQLVAGLDADFMGTYSADAYEIAAKEGCVALVYGEKFTDMFILKSTDGGNNWTRNMVFDNPIPNNLDMNFETFDTTFVPNGSYGIAIDNNNNVHIAYGIVRVLRDASSEAGYYSYYPGYMTLGYWNETMAPFASTNNALDPDTLVANNYPTFTWHDLTGYNQDTAFYWSTEASGVDLLGNSYKADGHMTHPKLICDGNSVYLFYTSALPFPLADHTYGSYWHGVFGTKSLDNGTTWDVHDKSWISYGNGLYKIDWEMVQSILDDPDSYPEIESWDDVIATSLIMESENAFPSIALAGNNIHIVWFNDAISGVEESFPTSDYYMMYHTSIPKDQVGIYNNVLTIPEGSGNNEDFPEDPGTDAIANNSIENISIYPNPASDRVFVAVNTTNANNATITITNLMGQTVYTSAAKLHAGENLQTINTSNFSSGLYLLNVKTNNGVKTHKFVVK